MMDRITRNPKYNLKLAIVRVMNACVSGAAGIIAETYGDDDAIITQLVYMGL